jgi:hypothetical protein
LDEGSGTGDDPRGPREEGRQMVTEAHNLPIRLRLPLGSSRTAYDAATRE